MMSILTSGRVNQKLRTRNALVDAASSLLRDGKTFTVADVADLAKVGRTTAYRYFPTVDALVAQASAHAVSLLNERSMDAVLQGEESFAKRLRLVFESADGSVRDHEHLYRTMLRLSLTNGESDAHQPPRRSGIRQQVIETAVGGIRGEIGDKRYEALLAALTVLIGIEAEVVLLDVCLLSKDKARLVKLWAANALLQAAIAEAQAAPPAPPAAPRKARSGTKPVSADPRRRSRTA